MAPESIALNVPVLFAIAVPVLLFVLAGLDALSLTTAHRLSIGSSLAALFHLGVDEGRAASTTWPKALLRRALRPWTQTHNTEWLIQRHEKDLPRPLGSWQHETGTLTVQRTGRCSRGRGIGLQ